MVGRSIDPCFHAWLRGDSEKRRLRRKIVTTAMALPWEQRKDGHTLAGNVWLQGKTHADKTGSNRKKGAKIAGLDSSNEPRQKSEVHSTTHLEFTEHTDSYMKHDQRQSLSQLSISVHGDWVQI